MKTQQTNERLLTEDIERNFYEDGLTIFVPLRDVFTFDEASFWNRHTVVIEAESADSYRPTPCPCCGRDMLNGWFHAVGGRCFADDSADIHLIGGD
jgi:hypothetical protein